MYLIGLKNLDVELLIDQVVQRRILQDFKAQCWLLL